MPADHFKSSRTGQLRRRHIRHISDGKHLAPGNSGVFWPGDTCQSNHRIQDPTAHDTGYCNGKYHARKSQKNIRHSHKKRIQFPAVITAEDPRRAPDHRDHSHQKKGGKDRGPGSHDHTGKHVPSIAVRSKKMRSSRRQQRISQILLIRIIRNQIRRKHRRQDHACRQCAEKDHLYFYIISCRSLFPYGHLLFLPHVIHPLFPAGSADPDNDKSYP